MATGAKTGLGAQLQRDDGAGNYTTVPEVVSITGPEESLATVDATNLDSVNNYEEVIPGFLSGGDVSFELNWRPNLASHQDLASDLRNRTLRNFKLVFTQFSNRTFSFAAYVVKFGRTTAVRSKVTGALSLKVSGPVTES